MTGPALENEMRSSALLTLSTLALLTPSGAFAEETAARYQVTFERTWSKQTHPADFPLLAHFSPVIGLTHQPGHALFTPGVTASAGIEKLCEEGKHQPLDEEIRGAIASGDAGELIETSDPIREVPGRVTAEFNLDAAHPNVSVAAMIAPSPDWCAVATDVSLVEGGTFVERKTVDLYAWDAGTDSATSYRALDADMQPRGAEMQSAAPYFVRDGRSIPVGRVTFEKR